jgi:hypothetical protein
VLQPEYVATLWLLRILRRAWKHMRDERCPRQPKSIHTKAKDLLHNLRLWLKHVQAMILKANPVSLANEKEACEAVMRSADHSRLQLDQLVSARVEDHDSALDEYEKLFADVGAVINTLCRLSAEGTNTTVNGTTKPMVP